MTEKAQSEKSQKVKRAKTSALRTYLMGRLTPLTSAILVMPLFLIYQMGILLSDGMNGADFVTSALLDVCARDLPTYAGFLGATTLFYVALLVILRRYGSFTPRAFAPMLLESTFYALSLGSVILFVMQQLPIAPHLVAASRLAIGARGPVDILVMSAGAGLHEELVFRVVGVGGLAWLLTGVTGEKRAWLLAVVGSSLVFSFVHHLGPLGEPFTFAAFVYRTLAGLCFALIYQVRGFAVAAWTHALYDVYVMSLTPQS